MKKNHLLLVAFAAAFALSGCSNVSEGGSPESQEDSFSSHYQEQNHIEDGSIQEGYLLVKAKNYISSMLGELSVRSVEPLYEGSDWQFITLLPDTDTKEAADYLRSLNTFEAIDFDYLLEADAIPEDAIRRAPNSANETYLETHGVLEARAFLQEAGENPGGDSSVVVAVIDTGVDYSHPDLRNNIWTNTGEIPNNGIDDDGNGFIDDYHGWNFVSDNNEVMDDNGHGTHVAGIVAAEKNDFGVTGIAYNTKIMPVKAADMGGVLTNSAIARAIQYAYMNGATVINMSFGGTAVTLAMEEALEYAYSSSILVASAGNDVWCNTKGDCLEHPPHPAIKVFPASFPYVIGVMSSNQEGTRSSSFSNLDHEPYNEYEYEVYATGEAIYSTWPNGGYQYLSGTSMAAPVISGMAAILRSHFSDREVYSSKFIQSQIVNTSQAFVLEDEAHPVPNLDLALETVPTPSLALYDSYTFDRPEISASNDNDGVVDAGEVIEVGVELFNRGGVASDISLHLESIYGYGEDPYVTIVKDSLSFPDCGTYSKVDGGKLFDENDRLVGFERCFKLKISPDCPNDHRVTLPLRVTYKNGLSSADTTVYQSNQNLSFIVKSGYDLPSVIAEDTVFSNTQLYFVNQEVKIPTGVHVTFEAGCTIEFYAAASGYFANELATVKMSVYGTLDFNGTAEDRITIRPSENGYRAFACSISSANFSYCDVYNLVGALSPLNQWTCYGGNGTYYADHSTFRSSMSPNDRSLYCIVEGLEPYLTFPGDMSGYYAHWFETFDSCIYDLGYMHRSASGRVYTVCREAQKSLIVLPSCTQGFYYADFVAMQADSCIFLTKGDGDPDQPMSRLSVYHGENNVFRNLEYSQSVRKGARFATENGKNVYDGVFDRFYDSLYDASLSYYGAASAPARLGNDNVDTSECLPYVTKIEIKTLDGDVVKTIGGEKVKVHVYFNTNMDTNENPLVGFGSRTPFSDYMVQGDYINSREWVGEYQLKAYIEGGENYFSVRGAKSADGEALVDSEGFFNFTIVRSSSMSMNMQANATNEGILLSWEQDDYDTLMGYNVYRSEDKDGNFVRLNTSVIPATTNTYLDRDAEPGKTYWYTFTVVLSDMSESKIAGKVSATAQDTIAPNIYHTPVNQGYLNNNLVISCTASDNIEVRSVTLYYHTVGQTAWKSLAMSRQNNRYSGVIFGSELSLDGIVYYIVASDGYNSISKGSVDDPYRVIIKDSSALLMVGDVDFDGVITTKDALMIMQAINGDLILTDDQFKRADLNQDGVLSSFEALRILQYINGTVTTLAM